MALQADKRKLVRLYYGTFNPDSTAYRDLLSEWESTGIKVCLGVLAKVSGCCDMYQALRLFDGKLRLRCTLQVTNVYSGYGDGYVQNVFEKVTSLHLLEGLSG